MTTIWPGIAAGLVLLCGVAPCRGVELTVPAEGSLGPAADGDISVE